MRSEARGIGQRALRHAAAERARHTLLAAERQAVLAALAEGPHSLSAAAACVASHSWAGAVASATRATARDINVELMEGIDMAPLFRRASPAHTVQLNLMDIFERSCVWFVAPGKTLTKLGLLRGVSAGRPMLAIRLAQRRHLPVVQESFAWTPLSNLR